MHHHAPFVFPKFLNRVCASYLIVLLGRLHVLDLSMMAKNTSPVMLLIPAWLLRLASILNNLGLLILVQQDLHVGHGREAIY
ncbi:unnamed protein product [Linum trigynum]|uniref:Uncharacterized protein n=1 Tax=Linum trigynum TaxID=586398 RepID=A0AAV2G6S2_9ROSI